MMQNIFQFLITGLTVGSTYALIALGFTLIFNVSHVVNFAQGEFVMIGAMAAIFFAGLKMPLLLAIVLAIIFTVIIGILFEKFAIEQAKGANLTSLIIITIGASIFFRGLALVLWGKNILAFSHFSGETPIKFFGATILPQHIWIISLTTIVVFLLAYFFAKTLFGKAILACSYNNKASKLIGINVNLMLVVSYGISAGIGALAGVLIAPISYMSYESGTMLGLKGFCAAILGGMGNSFGSVLGGLLLGIVESMTSGIFSSAYKDAVSFIIVLLLLFVRPQGLFGKGVSERV
jgi:branched-chain amino acid transport system permease protein